MRITKIYIKNFRSVTEVTISPTAFNIHVGQNNHGKTNLFEAINWFFGSKQDAKEISHRKLGGEVRVEIDFDDVQAGIRSMKNPKNQASIQKAIGERDRVRVVRTTLEAKRVVMDVDTQQVIEPGTGFDAALNDFLPKFEYVHTRLHLEDVAEYGKNTPIGIMLSGVLEAILETNPDYQKFKQEFQALFGNETSDVRVKLNDLSGKVKVYLQKQFPDCVKVQFEVSQPEFEDLLKNFETSVDDGVDTDACEKGDGMQRALMLAIIQAYADFRRETQAQGRTFLFFVDEGELHLHPTAQRQLKKALLDIAQRGDQVFLNTHSSVLVADNDDAQTIYRVEKLNGETKVSTVAQEGKTDVVYELLGGSPADLLLPRNFLIVEGKCEYELINRIINRFYSDKPRIQIVYAEGDCAAIEKSMDAINKTMAPLYGNPIYKEKLVILSDAPHPTKQSDFDDFKRAYSALDTSGRLFVLSTTTIEGIYPSPWKKNETEVRAMESARNAKLVLSRTVSSEITQAQFESDMQTVFNALTKCWEAAYV